jgi:hypothetical protein
MDEIFLSTRRRYGRFLVSLLFVGAGAAILGTFHAPERTWPNLLVDSFYLLSLAVAAIFFIASQRLCGARWSASLRRIPEAFMALMPVAAVLMLMVFLGRQWIYPWSRAGAFAGVPDMAGKVIYLQTPAVIERAVAILASWIVFAWLFRKVSLQQDRDPDLIYHQRLNRYSAIFVVVLAVSLTLGSFDWLISLEPDWFSTVYAIYVFSGCFVQGLSGVTLAAVLLKERGFMRERVTREQLHNLGRLLFAFSTFWAYIWTVQYLLIWYVNLPDEVTYYVKRVNGPWLFLFVLNPVANWVVPFILLLSADAKRNPRVLKFVCVLLLWGHWLDLYLLIMPSLSGTPRIGLLEPLIAVGYAGLFGLVFLRSLTKASLVPRNDPFLASTIDISHWEFPMTSNRTTDDTRDLLAERMRVFRTATFGLTTVGLLALVYRPSQNHNDLPNRIPEAPPYITSEAQYFPPPFEEHWAQENNPGQCRNCHQKIFDEWNGSMMSNSWRDPVWRGAFLLSARETSAYGECDTPQPPDGTPKAEHNPFATKGECSSTFNLGTERFTISRPGSLLDGFCSRCHMPTNYTDNVPLHNVKIDPRNRMESATVDPSFNPTSDNGTGMAFAELASQLRNTDTGKSGIFCAICHTFAATRDTPFHNYVRSTSRYTPALGTQSRSELLPVTQQDTFLVPNPAVRNQGYSIGAGAYQLSPHAIGFPERLGPLAANIPANPADSYVSQVFDHPINFQHMDPVSHQGYHNVMIARAEMCAACHDVTNALPIKNPLGKWVGGFPIERTYTEWANSRYADRPGNTNYDPHFKRDCQTCHMQQDYGQPGTAQTLYKDGVPLPPPEDQVASNSAVHPFFTHHFVGGNAYVTRMIGTDVDRTGNVSPYPELSAFSFSSADKKSPYANAYWTQVNKRGGYVQQARLAWDRLRHVLSLTIQGPVSAPSGSSVPISIQVANTGSGHNFPTGFPEGRTAWLAVRAYDLATGKELQIHDSFWNRDSLGVGRLTTQEMVDPNFPASCQWQIPPGSADPYSVQFKAVASQGDGCPTLDLVYATPLNIATNSDGLPIDQNGRVIDPTNPTGLPLFKDVNGNGDLFDDSYLKDTRLKPMPHPGATVTLDRYSVVVPAGTTGPIAVTAAVYYQSVEAVVAQKFLGNLADLNGDSVLQPCVLGGLCDGRRPNVEPAVVEGAPPVPMALRNWVIAVNDAPAKTQAPAVATYPKPGVLNAYQDLVVKVTFSVPVQGVNAETFILTNSHGARIPAAVDQIGDGTWGLFPNEVFLPGGEYTATLKAGIGDQFGGRIRRDIVWSFTVSDQQGQGTGDTSVPIGFTTVNVSQSSALIKR